MLLLVSGDRNELYILGPTEQDPPEDGDRIKSQTSCVLNESQDDG
jgi:hypothetical protein